ncbi:penicillin-binding transpeptidase domain-containing protein [Otariodibacter oris]|uniref:Peptidoglycan D,D-transpeptidase FtsI n=1 Tax=Otariodibacter oris TaxID=1032623 RepID=A0A420XJY5_9PAST|nr:penicillin-binding transpeptidase domain-containing protein [Otariodibacter oris]QGM80405.1 cell division protein FtsI [Otariodibacter oris]RKR77451.1 peptidoglycan synthetase FtsI [Otariodibacter oris]
MKKAVKFKSKKAVEKAANHIGKESKNSPSFMPYRFGLLYIFVACLAFALLGQSAYLQVTDAERLIKEANNRSLRVTELPFTRGQILDRNNRVLSISVPMYSITIDPKEYFDAEFRRDKKRWRSLAMETGYSASKIEASVNNFIEQKIDGKQKRYDARFILNTDNNEYWSLLAKATGIDYNVLIENVRNNKASQFLALEKEAATVFKEKIEALTKSLDLKYADLMNKLYSHSESRFQYISRHQPEAIADYARALRIRGMVLKTESRRFYPLAEEISQLVGFTDVENEKGIEGLERNFDSLLVGKNGKKITRKDSRGNIVENIRNEKQYDPQNVVLSIDAELQSMVYREIKKAVIKNKAESGTAVLVDVQTGEILAMANAPSYNPNNRVDFKPELARNRAITDTFEPGSTVKPFVVLTALYNKVTYPDEVIDTRPFRVNGHLIKDVSARSELTLTGILQKSSNVGVSRLALRMPSTALMDTYTKIGFGKDTELGLGEERGSNGDRQRWSDIERATVAYGYGLSVTPLQLARAYATLGSFGIYRPLSITKVDPPVIGERALPEKITRDVVHMMESVAQKGEGGQLAAVDGFRVAIKTGTARKLEKGEYVDKYIAYTAGLAPASDPRFALVVLINEPTAGKYYGGSISAPLFSSIMGYTLKARNIKPDNITDEMKSAVIQLAPNKIN